jgi:hypothetical protein
MCLGPWAPRHVPEQLKSRAPQSAAQSACAIFVRNPRAQSSCAILVPHSACPLHVRPTSRNPSHSAKSVPLRGIHPTPPARLPAPFRHVPSMFAIKSVIFPPVFHRRFSAGMATRHLRNLPGSLSLLAQQRSASYRQNKIRLVDRPPSGCSFAARLHPFLRPR